MNKRHSFFLTPLVAIVMLALMASGPEPHAEAAQEFTPVFEPAVCPLALPPGVHDGEDVRCGFVTVPERHARPQGPTIQLAVAVIKGTGNRAVLDPIVFIDGGPGLSSLSETLPLLVSPLGEAIRATGRDLALVEQRGNYHSLPSLACPEVFGAIRQSVEKDLDTDARRSSVVDAYGSCYRRLTSQGIDLSAYNSIENAADFPLVVRALGYRDYNVYGVSYGTEVAQHLMHQHPEGIRSVVLSAVIPLDLNVNAAIPDSAGRAFQLLFSSCAADAACHSSYPVLSAVFRDLVETLQTTPFHVPVRVANRGASVIRTVTGDDVVRMLSESFDAENIPSLPRTIYELAGGDSSWVAARAGAGSGTGTEALGLTYSVICSEGAAFGPSDLALESSIERAMAAGRPLEMLAVCKGWDVARLDTSAHKRLESEIPTLLMAGDFDIITPPPFLARVAAGLKHAYPFAYPGQGHGGIDACRLGMTLAFLDDPTRAPDAGCIAAMHVTFETPATQPSPR